MSDLISRKAAIDALGERPMVWMDDDDYALGERNQYDMDKLAIETVPSAQPEQRWIPCSERFPDKEMPIWVSMCDDNVLKAIWRNGWCAPNGYKMGLTDGQVIAWMPRETVPEPYREEGDE